ncbi:MAG: ABC transporter permease [Saprospiraceae bacterium]|nr:ABC transporter permease [Saprospiraceae bacterium]
MNILSLEFLRSLVAESFKLKRTPILWLSLIGGVTSAIVVFLLFFFLIDEFIELNKNPWARYFQLSFNLLSTLLLIPYVILVNSSIVQSEHNSNSWKYLYALPVKKSSIYFPKLLMTIALVALTLVIFFVTSVLGGYLLGVLRPEYEFNNYPMHGDLWMGLLVHAFLSILGVTAIQYWISIRWKNYIIPIGIGMMGFIFSILVVDEEKFAIYLPYCYSMFVSQQLDFEEIFNSGKVATENFRFIEWYSLICFVVFSLIGFYEQKIRNVK